MSLEKKPLVTHSYEECTDKKGWSLKHGIIIPGIFFLFTGIGLQNILLNEWIQNKIQNERFPNMSSDYQISACNDTNKTDPVYIRYESVQHDSALWIMYNGIALHVPMFLSNMVLAGYTDAYGRKFLFILAPLGVTLKYMVITAIINWNLSLVYVVAIHVLEGITGSTYSIFAVSFAYIADITYMDNHRVLGVVIVEATVILAMTLSSLLSGYLIQTINLGYFSTSFISSAVSLLGVFIFLLLLPESLPKYKRRPAQQLRGTLKSMVQFYITDNFKGKRLSYILLLLSFFFSVIGLLNRTNIETLYFLGQPFCWGPSKIGLFTMTRSASFGIVGLCALKLLQMCFSNEFITLLSAISATASFVIEAFAKTDVMIYMVPVVGLTSFLTVPLIRGIMSTMTEPDKQGAMFSGIATIEVLSSIAGSLSENEIYANTYSFMNGFVFLVMAGFCVIDFGLLCAFYIRERMKTGKSNQLLYEPVENINN